MLEDGGNLSALMKSSSSTGGVNGSAVRVGRSVETYTPMNQREKGIGEVLAASDELIKQIPDLEWHICGAPEKGEEYWLAEITKRPWIKYHGVLADPGPMYAMVHVTITTTYHEGLSTVCIESGACARPVIGSDIYGVREVISDRITGFLISPGRVSDVVEKIGIFYKLTIGQRLEMGRAARQKVELEFDRKIVVVLYKKVINEYITKKGEL